MILCMIQVLKEPVSDGGARDLRLEEDRGAEVGSRLQGQTQVQTKMGSFSLRVVSAWIHFIIKSSKTKLVSKA